MPNMTMALPEDLHAEMRSHPEIKWTEVARAAFRREVSRIHLLDEVLADSRLRVEDAVDLGREVRHAAYRRRRNL